MDTFRLNPDAVRQALPSRGPESEPDDNERRTERVREVESRVENDDEARPGQPG